jgi:hypothetical protein
MIDLSWIQDLPPKLRLKLLKGPALPAPDGYESHLNNPPNRNELGYIVLVLVSVFATLLVTLRLYSRVFIQKMINVEDCT